MAHDVIHHRLLVTNGELKGTEYPISDAGFEIRPRKSDDLEGSYRVVIEGGRAALLYYRDGQWQRLGELEHGDFFISRNSEFTYQCGHAGDKRQTSRPRDYSQFPVNLDSIQPELPGAVSIRPLSEEIDLTLKRILRFLFDQMRKVVWAAVILENPLGNGEMSAVFSPEPFSLDNDLIYSVLRPEKPKVAAASKTDACAVLSENGWRFGVLYVNTGNLPECFELGDLQQLAQIAKVLSPFIAERIYLVRLRQMSN